MGESNFEVSGYPNYIEWYKCYEDPASGEWIDGMEFKNNPDWDEKQKAKWHFFYRPIPALVGRPQKKEIRKLEDYISQIKNELQTSLATAQRELQQARSNAKIEIDKLFKTFLHSLIIFGVGLITSFFIYKLLVLIPILYGIIQAINYLNRSSNITRHLDVFENEITKRTNQMKEKCSNDIRQIEAGIHALRKEIKSLLLQITDCPRADEIEEWFRQEIKDMERKCLSEIVNDEIDEAKMKDLIRHKPITELVDGLLIQGWGLLQPSVITSPSFGKEKTGSERVRHDIGARIATWRMGTKRQPIYRVLYLQYVFLLEKNINVYGFFYDFITRKPYGKRSETFQYNHVTNFSIREVQIEEENWVKVLGLPATLTNNLFGKEINAFSLVVASGAYFSCVLVDEAVVEGMNRWLKVEEEIRELKQEDIESADRLKKSSGEKELKKWNEDDVDRAELLKHFVRKKDAFEEQDLHIARKALQQVRESVERFARF